MHSNNLLKSYQLSNLDILGALIGDYLFCSGYVCMVTRESAVVKLLTMLDEVATGEHVKRFLLVTCSSFKLAKATKLDLIYVRQYDLDIRRCFSYTS